MASKNRKAFLKETDQTRIYTTGATVKTTCRELPLTNQHAMQKKPTITTKRVRSPRSTCALARVVLPWLACVCLLLLQIGCATLEGVSDLWTAPVTAPLKVGVTPNTPPLIFKDKQDGSLCGFEAECARRLALRLERELRFVELAWEEQIPALERGEIDIIMSGMTITEMRSTRVAFSDSYMDIGQMVLVRAADAGKYPEPQDVLNTTARIGVETGTAGDFFVQRYCVTADPLFYPSSDAAINALKEGKIDLLIHDAPLIWSHADQETAPALNKLPDALTCEQLAWAVHKEDKRLLRQVNRALAAWKKDGSLQRLLAQWIPR
mgnify:CR=1 FL=1